MVNDENLFIGLYYGSLVCESCMWVEVVMVVGELCVVVVIGSLDLGIDWGVVDLVI